MKITTHKKEGLLWQLEEVIDVCINRQTNLDREEKGGSDNMFYAPKNNKGIFFLTTKSFLAITYIYNDVYKYNVPIYIYIYIMMSIQNVLCTLQLNTTMKHI